MWNVNGSWASYPYRNNSLVKGLHHNQWKKKENEEKKDEEKTQ